MPKNKQAIASLWLSVLGVFTPASGSLVGCVGFHSSTQPTDLLQLNLQIYTIRQLGVAGFGYDSSKCN
ncbi:hypothetical protein, partial [Chamaesiphon sp. OTE_20_metabat_361]|uniref:hypothetical protein n=1 Tax=Chamaesiphon sp. OTE_20_metabat_361 TaxID=2964689 RepID=UPI00286C2DAA